MLSSIGVPGLNGFVGEFLILIGSFLTARWWTVVAATGVILAALYLLWAYQRVFHGEPDEDNRTFPELTLQGRPRAAAVHRAHRASPASTRSRCSTGSSRASTASIAHVETQDRRVDPGAAVRRARAARKTRPADAGSGPSRSSARRRLVRALAAARAPRRRRCSCSSPARSTPTWPRGLYALRSRRRRRRRRRAGDRPVGRRHRQRHRRRSSAARSRSTRFALFVDDHDLRRGHPRRPDRATTTSAASRWTGPRSTPSSSSPPSAAS